MYGSFYVDGWMSFLLLAWTGSLIAFYDLAGKYLVAPGLLTLALIRFFHCLIPAPKHVIIDRDEDGEITTRLFAKEQSYKSMLKTLRSCR